MGNHTTRRERPEAICQCGCGEVVPQKAGAGRPRKWADGHDPRYRNTKNKPSDCMCGCGKPVHQTQGLGRRRKYRDGHDPRQGMRPETCKHLLYPLCGCTNRGTKGRYRKTAADPDAGFWRSYFNIVRGVALARTLPFELTIEQVKAISQCNCTYCGDAPSVRTINGRYTDNVNGIDRIDNKTGYLPGNVQPCCSECNRMKGTLTDNEFRTKIQKISSFLTIYKNFSHPQK